MRERIGSFRLLRRLGEGGMGVVFEAKDERLDRSVAIKMIREDTRVQGARERFWREARAAARVSHPNVCQLFDVGEEDGALYIAMELLEGESLSARLERGALPLAEAGQVTLGILAALEALHRHSIVHRDLKPSNVFLTAHGVKLLDFGLARGFETERGETADASITQTGIVVGTPRYMSPEQWQGQSLDARSDVFASGALLFEMLTGAPAFPGNSPAEVRHATLFGQPPVLAGPASVAALDDVLHRALAKDPDGRFESASAMAGALREALRLAGDTEVPRIRAVTRLIVLPFRVLRPDPNVDFLSYSLPDAITASLAGFESLVVRSALSAARFGTDSPDIRRVASESEVDLVLTGSLLASGGQLRASTQLIEAQTGTVLWSTTTDGSLGDIFQLQDSLARKIVESLSLSLSGRERNSLQRDVPASAKAYEFFLRANELARDAASWTVARDLYLRCLDADPRYAPAWARLGRVYRLLSKYSVEHNSENLMRAAEAFRRALELNPDLSIALNLRANLEVEMGHGCETTVELMRRARLHPNDPELYAGLVHSTRYCGLLEASVAADRMAHRLDPTVPTSVRYTYWMQGDFEKAIAEQSDYSDFLGPYALTALGRLDEARRIYEDLERSSRSGIQIAVYTSQRAALQGNREEFLAANTRIAMSGFRDPEGLYFQARTAAFVHSPEVAFALLDRVVNDGFLCHRSMDLDPWLDGLRGDPEYRRIHRISEERHREARVRFLEAGGDRLLGISSV